MTKVVLLEQLKAFTEASVHKLILPVAQQKEDKEPPQPRPAEVYRARLPDGKAAKTRSSRAWMRRHLDKAGQRKLPSVPFSVCITLTSRRADWLC